LPFCFLLCGETPGRFRDPDLRVGKLNHDAAI
jgi:hypothetical protein